MYWSFNVKTLHQDDLRFIINKYHDGQQSVNEQTFSSSKKPKKIYQKSYTKIFKSNHHPHHLGYRNSNVTILPIKTVPPQSYLLLQSDAIRVEWMGASTTCNHRLFRSPSYRSTDETERRLGEVMVICKGNYLILLLFFLTFFAATSKHPIRTESTQ